MTLGVSSSSGCASPVDPNRSPGATPRESPIALHAARLIIQHPVRYEPLPILAPIPRTWNEFGFRVVKLDDGWGHQE